MKFGGSREHNYVTHTLAEHHRIVREGNRFKKDVSKIQKFINDFVLGVTITERKHSTKAKTKTRKRGKKQKRKPNEENEQEDDEDAPPLPAKKLTKQQKKANKRLDKIKRGGRKRMSRAEVDSTLKDSIMRLSDWSQRACDVMQQQMKDITKLYMATMDYNIHLNSAYPVPLPPHPTM